MVFIKAHRKHFLAGSLAAAVAAFTVTACGGGGAAAPAQGAAPGQWTKAEVSQFTAAAGADGSASQESCAIGYFERDMSFGNAMAVVSVAPASGPSMSAAQVKAALVSKYGTTEGDAIDAQFDAGRHRLGQQLRRVGGRRPRHRRPPPARPRRRPPTRPRRRSHRAPWTA